MLAFGQAVLHGLAHAVVNKRIDNAAVDDAVRVVQGRIDGEAHTSAAGLPRLSDDAEQIAQRTDALGFAFRPRSSLAPEDVQPAEDDARPLLAQAIDSREQLFLRASLRRHSAVPAAALDDAALPAGARSAAVIANSTA